MNKALRPCPFCGGSDVYMGRDPGDERDHVVWCRSCGAHGGAGYYPGLARENWNRRAERTCHMTFEAHEYRYRCSRCGCLSETYRSADGKWYAPDYCPRCGARVATEEA